MTDQLFASKIWDFPPNVMSPPASSVNCPVEFPVLELKFQIVFAFIEMLPVACKSMVEKTGERRVHIDRTTRS